MEPVTPALDALGSSFLPAVGSLSFGRPDVLYLLLVLPVWWVIVWPRAGRGVLFSRGESARRTAGWGRIPHGILVLILPLVLRSLVMGSLVVALADPHRTELTPEIATRGKGIGLAVDLSSSMLAKDMEGGRDRITVAREAAVRFAEGRPLDELSLIGFSGQAVTRVPPTSDSRLIVQGVESLRVQLVRDGTDISGALLTVVSRMRESEREPRVVILLTDGAHNGVGVPPLAAARAAAALGVRVHAISVLGPEAGARLQATGAARAGSGDGQNMRTVLEGIAGVTGGRYFHASSGTALDSIYREIDRIEQPVEEVTEVGTTHPVRAWPLLAGLLFLGLEGVLRGSRLGVVT